MPRFYLHLRDGIDELIDPEGAELIDVQAAAARALKEARCILSDEVKTGRVKLAQRIDVEDQGGSLVYSLPFTDALEIVHDEPPPGGFGYAFAARS
jgi:hypothetical protein